MAGEVDVVLGKLGNELGVEEGVLVGGHLSRRVRGWR